MPEEKKYSAPRLHRESGRNVKHIIGLNETASKKEEKLNDQKLWFKIKMGSEGAFRELFLKYNNILTRYGASVMEDPGLVEDCIHDLFLYLWSKKDTLSDVESVKYYLIVSFRRRIFKVLKEREKGQKLLEGIRFEYPKYEDFFEQRFIVNQDAHERERSLKNAVDELPERQKEVLHLRFIEGLPYQEISLKMGISNVSVRKLSSKAIRNLRKKIS
ncbi:MAG: sigma-70 family RNA polymerase sigma factor [Cytophagales bacterium]|nr:sigma-70 family RNA polymerase sigma factor [Cytophagales bacterium]